MGDVTWAKGTGGCNSLGARGKAERNFLRNCPFIRLIAAHCTSSHRYWVLSLGLSWNLVAWDSAVFVSHLESTILPDAQVDFISPLLHVPRKARENLSQNGSTLGIGRRERTSRDFGRNSRNNKGGTSVSFLMQVTLLTPPSGLGRTDVLLSPSSCCLFPKATTFCLPCQKCVWVHCVCPGLPFLTSLLSSDNTHDLHLLWWQNISPNKSN